VGRGGEGGVVKGGRQRVGCHEGGVECGAMWGGEGVWGEGGGRG